MHTRYVVSHKIYKDKCTEEECEECWGERNVTQLKQHDRRDGFIIRGCIQTWGEETHQQINLFQLQMVYACKRLNAG